MSFVIWLSGAEGAGTYADPIRPIFGIAQHETGFPNVFVGDSRMFIGIADVEAAEAARADEIGSLRGGEVRMMAGEAGDQQTPLTGAQASGLRGWLSNHGVTADGPIVAGTTIGQAFLRIARVLQPGVTREWFLDGLGRHPNRRR